MYRNPIMVALWAVFRRFLIIGGSAVLAYLVANWGQWAQKAFELDPNLLHVWMVIYPIIEFVQKSIREHSRQNSVNSLLR